MSKTIIGSQKIRFGDHWGFCHASNYGTVNLLTLRPVLKYIQNCLRTRQISHQIYEYTVIWVTGQIRLPSACYRSALFSETHGDNVSTKFHVHML